MLKTMEGLQLCVLVFLIATVTASPRNVVEYEMENVSERDEARADNRWLEKAYSRQKQARLQKWAFNDCSGGNSPMKINSLDISPDPVEVPGPLNVAASIDLKTDLVAPVQGNITILRYSRVFKKYMKLPCIANFGSCVYDDICSLLGQITACPDPLVKIGLTCHCPIKQNSYTLEKTEFDIDSAAFPTGDFIMTGNLSYSGKEFGCLNITIAFE